MAAEIDDEPGLDDELPGQARALNTVAPIPPPSPAPSPLSPNPGLASPSVGKIPPPNISNGTPPLTLRGLTNSDKAPAPISGGPVIARPMATSNRGRAVNVQTPDGMIPANPATGGLESLNNKGNPIKPGVAGLWARADNIESKPLRIGAKIGAGVLRGLDVAGGIAAPRITAAIPGSSLNEQGQELDRKQKQAAATAEQEKEAQTAEMRARIPLMQSEEEKNRADAAAKGESKLLPGEENVRTQPDGTRERAYEKPDGTIEWKPEGQATGAASVGGTSTSAAPVSGTSTGAGPTASTGAASVAGTSESGPTAKGGQPVYGKPAEKELPASTQDLATLTQAVAGSPYLTPEQKNSAGFPEGYVPTQNELKTRMDAVRAMETNARQGKQDEFNNNLRQIAAQNSALLSEAHLQDLAEKKKKVDAEAVMTADSGYAGLYAQENYKEKAEAWHESANFAKDSGLVDSIINQVHGESGLPSIGGGATIGALLGGPGGAAVGAAVPVLGNLIMPMAQGYLDAAKRQGISKEGYEAMQAYFNALPARLAYETSVQGVKAGTMRAREVINKVLQTVPPPNTPGDRFENAFTQYYQPMKALTERKAKLIAPAGYQPPARESFYPPESSAASTTGASGRNAKIGGQEVQIGTDGTFQLGGHTYKVNPDGKGGTLVH